MTLPGRGEQGAALVWALVMAAALSLVAFAVLGELQLGLRQAAHLDARTRAGNYAEAAALAARQAVARAARRRQLAKLLRRSDVGLPITDGIVRARFADGGSCFNLNALAAPDPGAAARTLTALLRGAGLSPEIARRRVAALADWMDADDVTRPGGAEDSRYARLVPPYRTSGQLLADTSELRRITGFDPPILAELAGLVCVDPVTAMRQININSLEQRHAPLLAALCDGGPTVETLAALIAARPAGGYASLEEFLAEREMRAATDAVERCRPMLSARTELVEVHIKARVGKAGVTLAVVLAIDSGGQAREVQRRYGART